MIRSRNEKTKQSGRIPLRFIQALTGTAALLAISISPSVGCGDEGFGRGFFIPDPGSDVTDQLVVQEGSAQAATQTQRGDQCPTWI